MSLTLNKALLVSALSALTACGGGGSGGGNETANDINPDLTPNPDGTVNNSALSHVATYEFSDYFNPVQGNILVDQNRVILAGPSQGSLKVRRLMDTQLLVIKFT